VRGRAVMHTLCSVLAVAESILLSSAFILLTLYSVGTVVLSQG
jgi:hypothetical protein